MLARGLVVAVMAILGAAACDGGDDEPSSGETPGATPEATETGFERPDDGFVYATLAGSGYRIAVFDAALMRMAPRTDAFLAVSDGPSPIHYIAHGSLRTVPVFCVEAIDTLAAGDVFHAGFALALAEGCDEVTALRFGSAAAGLKCTRFGGSMGAPARAEVEALLKRG